MNKMFRPVKKEKECCDHNHHGDYHSDHYGDHHKKHDHYHDHYDEKLTHAFIVGIGLNLLFTAIEFFYGVYSHSLALVADAGHNLSDVLGLVIGLFAVKLLQKNANAKFTFGLKGSTILSALFNSLLLFLAVGAILWEAVHRFFTPTLNIQSDVMIIVASIGIVINFTTAMFFHSHHHDDLNAKGAFLHLMGDAAISLGVVITGFIIKYTGLVILDPIISILIGLIIIYGTWNLFKESLALSLNGVPEKIQIEPIETYLKNLKGVTAIYDLHIFALSTTENALMVHLIMDNGHPGDSFLEETEEYLLSHFHIQHTTIQITKNKSEKYQSSNCYHPKH